MTGGSRGGSDGGGTDTPAVAAPSMAVKLDTEQSCAQT